ncbi:flagellar hook capping FlgD N-terminal domain-containing protein [Meridianimarinicoccus sp. MJW13]|uniref:flagellar hook capping FlgD N-terminal domain-containing protein n=1 Tax=Meridianimarinicoccus sp. MJW13 TaxID=2720031 RepID=UPI001868F344|nr:flagellar hook capping FlgD N-terminal domain-containing protein [Fluviibacterium sp. MJW13]
MISSIPSPTSPSPATAGNSGQTAIISSDFDTFLTMLTAQIQNQDPLNPMDSTDYAVQLATFSGVEQQVQTNELLRGLSGGGLSGIENYAGWVGMSARTDAPVHFDGTPVEVHFDSPPGLKSAELVVSSATGQEIHRRSVLNQTPPYSWDGISPGGNALLNGHYRLHVAATNADGTPQTLPVTSFSTVQEVRNGLNGPEIVLDHGGAVAVGSVAALRQK